MLLYVDATYASPFALSAFVAISEKQVDFKLQPVDLQRGEHLQPPYATLSRTLRLPMLECDGLLLTESSAIAEYADEVLQGARLYPATPRARARARQIQAWLRSDLFEIRKERPSETIFKPATLPPLTPAAAAMAQRLFVAAERWLGDELNVCGDWCIADVDLAVMLMRLIANGDAVPAVLVRYARRQWQRPSVRAWLALPR